MALTPVRVTGLVTSIDTRSGTKDGNEWSITEATVLVAGRGTVAFNGSTRSMPAFSQGSAVDVMCDLGTYRNEPALRYVEHWNDAKAAAILDAIALANAG